MKKLFLSFVAVLIEGIMTGSVLAQNIPTVTTDTRYARGATMAFGRLKKVSITGTTVSERGMCWAQHPEPTYDENHTTDDDRLNNNGFIYWIRNLQPATLYYMRGYAKTKEGDIGYGEDIKFYTLPKGQITFEMRDGGDQDTYNRIKAATQTAIDWWNNLTEMKGFHPNVGYSSGTPTADCSYGGWIRVGPNTSYQRAGTIMHEMLHGCGVIPWADTEWSRHTLRESVNEDGYGTGHWLGDRVTEVLRFWDNSTTAQLNGDYQHMWPYGINDASEDDGTDLLYIGNSLICQALGEDGLQHTTTQFAEPYYSLNQESTIKYYIKSEDMNHGLSTSFLIPNSTGLLQWSSMTVTEALSNDYAAWYISFTPQNQYYQLRNVATGQYLTFVNNTFKTITRSSLTSDEDFHLMKGRVDVNAGRNKKRGYWIIHPTNNWTPPCLTADTNGTITSSSFNISNASTVQRWLILSPEDMIDFDQPSRKKQTLEIHSLPTMIYGDDNYILPNTTVEGLKISWTIEDENIAIINSNILTIKEVGTTTVMATQEGNDEYEPLLQEFTLKIDKAQLKVIAKSYTIEWGDYLPNFEFSYIGFKYGDTENELTTKPTIYCTASSESIPGIYTIYVSNGEAKNYELLYENGTLIIQDNSSSIVFADANTKAVCTANWDKNGNGELSTQEAALVEDLGDAFAGNREITSFDELRYFTGLTEIADDAFNGCYALTSVTIPDNVERIGNSAFMGCFGLTGVEISESITSIGEGAFNYCSSLTKVKVGHSEPLPIESSTFSNRQNALLYVPTGCKAAFMAADYWKEFMAIIEVKTGDTNGDGNISIADVTALVGHLAGRPPRIFVVEAADANYDGEVNIADAMTIVKNILKGNNEIVPEPKFYYSVGTEEVTADNYTTANGAQYKSSLAEIPETLDLSAISQQQAVILLPEGCLPMIRSASGLVGTTSVSLGNGYMVYTTTSAINGSECTCTVYK